jgi:hypothetical protein
MYPHSGDRLSNRSVGMWEHENVMKLFGFEVLTPMTVKINFFLGCDTA